VIKIEITTIQLEKKLVKALQEAREYPRQTYNELIKSMLKVFKSKKQNNQYDEFLHKVQQAKMQELWDNEHDEIWETM
jgi:rRNA pseudouridine-1189 N-methylase Emg1 (Nep1/Mra1 family)